MSQDKVLGTTSNVLDWSVNGEIEFLHYKDEFFDGMKDVLYNAFYPNESVCNGVEINKIESEQARIDLTELCRESAKDGVSIVARDVKSKQIVGISINKIQVAAPVGEPTFFDNFKNDHCKSRNSKALMDLMIMVDAKVDLFDLHKTDCSFEIMFLGTLPEYGQRSIGRLLCEYSIALAAELKNDNSLDLLSSDLRESRKTPDIVTAIFSSRYSQKIGELLGFTTHYEMFYTELEFDGKTYAERISSPASISLTLASKKLK